MASKLNEHKASIAQRIGEGASLNAIARELTAAGVTTTAQNIGQWIKRREAMLKVRKKLAKKLTETPTRPNPN